MKTEDILNEREKTHGDFKEVARIYGHLKDVLGTSSKIKYMRDTKHTPVMLSLDMICLKMARIVCGDPNFEDHWDDIAGYARLGKGRKEKFSGAIIIDDPKKCKECSANIELVGVPCDKHISGRCAELKREFTQKFMQKPKEDYQLKEESVEGGPYYKDCERCRHDILCPCMGHLKEYVDTITSSYKKKPNKEEGSERICRVCNKKAEVGRLPETYLCLDCYEQRRWM